MRVNFKIFQQHALTISCLTLIGIAFLFNKNEASAVSEEANKKIVMSFCMDPGDETAGGIRGISNDCTTGSESCVDNDCPSGTEERPFKTEKKGTDK